jgi:hypothetical protein
MAKEIAAIEEPAAESHPRSLVAILNPDIGRVLGRESLCFHPAGLVKAVHNQSMRKRYKASSDDDHGEQKLSKL